ncbi:hypothetical protein [Arcobacter arenosus]|uniref:Uncharacterized protein n=1 Tax=Arcobacter arenosus TaxID=2576037 RepID=A0A5R8Y127_9BACT|nr:hypothetical protein [Arcobacter arenosus]TLP38559.1 hypothetical protein FDK22_08855 [Arcobacter arenosus]
MENIKEIISKSDYIITFGSFLAADNIEIQESIIEAIAKNTAEFVYMHPIDNIDLKVYYSQFIKYEVGSEEGIASLLLDTFVKNSDEKIQNYIAELDIGYISAESSAGEEEFEEALERANSKINKTLIVGRDIFSHERVENITKILSVISKFSDLKIVCLEKEYQKILDEICDESLEEPEELHSYNGTVVYRLYGEEDTNTLVGSASFERIAKVKDGDDIYINFNGEKIKRKFSVNKDLYGTIALCAMDTEDSSSLSQGYRYKQVKIEKVDA